MSRAHDIDNTEPDPLFQFDSYEPAEDPNDLEASAREPQSPPSCIADLTDKLSTLYSSSNMSWYREPSSSGIGDPDMTGSKGKSISLSVSTQTQELLEAGSRESPDDLFSVSFGSAISTGMYEPVLDLSFSPPSSLDLQSLRIPTSVPIAAHIVDSAVETLDGLEGKGKGREMPPSLPPLSFVTTELSYESSDWPVFDISASSLAGPSSYSSGYASIDDPEPSPIMLAVDSMVVPPSAAEESSSLARIPSRRRSLSNLSVRSKRSLSTASITKVKVKLTGSKGPGTLARKLLFKRRDSSPSTPTSPPQPSGSIDIVDSDMSGCADVGQTNCLTPWVHEGRHLPIPAASPVLEIDFGYESIEPAFPFYFSGRASDNSLLRTKGRSYSSPLPLPSTALDLVPATTTDIYKPVPPVIPNHFDEFLPIELKLHIFASLVAVHEAEYQKNIREGNWTVRKATSHKNKWVGRDRGIRELFKLSRVSKSWRTFVFDGQLWAKLDLRSFPMLPPAVLLQVSQVAGRFIRHINFTGHTDLSETNLMDITNHLCTEPSLTGDLNYTHLITIDLQGCSTLSTRSLHHLLIRSPSLRSLCLKGLTAVTNTTCDILAVYCPKLVSLDLSRCSRMNGEGIHSLISATLSRQECMPLKELRLSGIRRVRDDMMAALGKAAPYLEVLDLSYARDLHTSAVEAFVSCSEDDAAENEVVKLTAREAGRDQNDSATYWRRVTRLRHLSLSFCPMLTDHACSHLAHAVPKLELLELAGIGPDLGDDGLVRLLNTTPFIRRVDLEDASEITDDVLLAITPDSPTPTSPTRFPVPPRPGHALEHLIISYASNITNEAILDLITNCTRLHTLEADNTRMSGPIVKEFVRLAHDRKTHNSQVVAVDCRGVGEQTVKDLADETRPRIGWRSYEARKLGFLDARDEEGLEVGQDECDPSRVALKTFYSWQTVDAVRAAREKKRKLTRRGANVSSSSVEDSPGMSSGRARWWSPSGRRSGATSPLVMDMNNDNREGCTIM